MRFIAGSGFAARELTRAVVAGRTSSARARQKTQVANLTKQTEAVSR
jgi:hypothetical protein